ncbi:MAG: aspartate aminotransferase family protein [Deltaproteobacteria bacterium]|jgi:acetylornithine aminotransferase|nr:aspartate aminotransferase family protein [Deltaproteobacteria bacterium]
MSERFDALKAREERLLCRTYGRYPLSVVEARGARLTDIDGREYIDLLGGIAVANLGHCNEELAQLVERQARKLIHVSNLFYQEEQLELAERLLATNHLDKVFFCNSGAEANEAGIKLARRYMQRVKQREAGEIVTFSGAFHGRTLATVAATGQERFTDGFAPIPDGFVKAPWGDLAALEAAITPRTAAVLMEAIQGEGGIRPMSPACAQGVEALCRKHGILLICDEVQSGMGRTGKYWAFQHMGIEPDIITAAKAMANGLPLGAMMASSEAARGFAVGSHATTFGGGALIAAIGAKVLEIMERDRIVEHTAELGDRFLEKLRALAARQPGKIAEIRGCGLMLGIELAVPGKPVWEELMQRGFVLNLTQDTVLRLLPPLVIAEADLEMFLVALEEILSA